MKNSPRSRNSLLYTYIALAVGLFLLGVVGFARHAAWHNLALTPLDVIYLTFQLIPMNSGSVAPPVPLELEAARFFIPLLAASAAVQAFLGIFREQIHNLKLPWLKGHIIICGLSRKGFLLAGRFRQLGRGVVVIERDEENIWIESCRKQGMYILIGDAADPFLLKLAGVNQAEGLFAVCDDDGANAEIALRAQELTRFRKREALICLLHVSDPQLCDLLREREAGLEQSPFRLELFNVFERASRTMLQEYPAWDEARLDPAAPPQILIIGLGRMGENLLLHMARDWWSRQGHPTNRLGVTIIDRQAAPKTEMLCIRYPQLCDACDLLPLQMEIRSPEFERAEFLVNAQNQVAPSKIYICVDDDSLGLHAGLTLARRLEDTNIPIVIRMAEESGRAKLLEFRKNHHDAYRNLFAFGYLEHSCTPDLLKSTPRDLLARAAHEEYFRAQIQKGAVPTANSALRPWDMLDETYRRSNYQWAGHIPLLLKDSGYDLAPLKDWDAPSFRFSSAEVEAMARLEHELWCKDRLADGWRSSPLSNDLDARINPNLTAWEALSEDEKEKNRVLVRRIPYILGRVGYNVIKLDGGE